MFLKSNLKEVLSMITLYAALFSFLFYSCAAHKVNVDNHESYYKKVYSQSENTPYPNENFLFVKKMIVDNTDEDKKEYVLSSASGIALKREKNHVYGLTAAHWCVDMMDTEGSEYESYIKHMFGYKDMEEAKENMSDQVDFYGKTYYMDIIALDEKSDLCMIKFSSANAHKVKKIKIAKKQPKAGDKVYTASAPQGISDYHIRLHFEGMYSGCAAPGECFFTIPGVIGSSGSGVLNESGELVGLLNFSVVNFHNVTGGPSVYQIREFVLTNLGRL